MTISRRQITFGALAVGAAVVSYLSLGAVTGCAHFDIASFCRDLQGQFASELPPFSLTGCERLAARSTEVCGQLSLLGVIGLFVSSATVLVCFGEFVRARVDDNWSDEGL